MTTYNKDSNIGETPETSQNLGKFLGVGLVILALWSFLSEKKSNKISIAGIKKRRSKRLFYMLDKGKGLTAVARQDVDNIKQSNPNRLHAVWALTADDARALIKAGQGERYTGSTKKLDFAGHLLNCIGWQQVISKKGNEITRCFIYAPNCKTKACVKETTERKAEGWKPKGRKTKALQGISDIAQKADNYASKLPYTSYATLYEYIKNNRANGVSNENIYKNISINNKNVPLVSQKDTTEFLDFLIFKIDKDFGDTPQIKIINKRFAGVNLSCKQYVRDAYNKLRCKKYALTCASENECATQKAPIPWKPVDVEYTPKAIKSVAKMLANEMNQSIDDTKRVMRRIKYHGGIAPYSGGYLQEEYRDIPSKYKSKEGIKLDELAQEMEMNESELVEAIGKAEEARSRLPRKKSRFAVKDLMFEAESYLAKQEGLSGLGDYGYHYKSYDDPVDVSYAKKLIQSALAKNVDKLEPSQIQTLFVKLRDEESRLINYGFKGTSIFGDTLYTNLNYAINHLLKIYKPEEKKTTEKGGQMTLFGKLHPYYYKNTGAKVFVSDDIKYHRGPAFKRIDRYRFEILDENKEHMGTMSNREIEKLLTETKPAIQSYLFGKLVARKIAMQA